MTGAGCLGDTFMSGNLAESRINACFEAYLHRMLCYGMPVNSQMHFCLFSDSNSYAHFVFNAFDKDKNGSISFEVCQESVTQ